MTTPEQSHVTASFEEQLLRIRTLMLYGDLTPTNIRRLCEKLLILSEADTYPVRLVINSQKGCLDSAIYLHDMLNFCCKANLFTIAAGIVAGPAVLIFSTPPRERRYTLNYTRFNLSQSATVSTMIDSTSTTYIPQSTKLRNHMVSILGWQTGQNVDRIETDIQTDNWLSAKEAVTYGLAGQIITAAQEVVMPKKLRTSSH